MFNSADTPNESIPPSSGFRRHRKWIVVALLGTLALIAVASYERKSKMAQGSYVYANYVGNDACAPCHQKEFDLHKHGSHMLTLRPVEKVVLGTKALTPGPIPTSNMEIFETPKGFAMGFQGKPEGAEPMQLALGSNHIAFTFVNIVDNRAVMELRQTYHSRTNTWHVTPGQPEEDNTQLGKTFNEFTSRRCLGCHVTALPENTLTPEPKFYGVGCEACHGAGKKHIDAILAGETKNIAMEKLGNIGATRLNYLCGSCHRTARDVSPEEEDMTQRFASYGLMKSRCYTESGDTLSCITCHDPHTNAKTDVKSYDRACLSCHASSKNTSATNFGPTTQKQKPCPVKPKSDCTTCHMPKRQAGPGLMADHFIRVFKQ